MCMLLFVVFPLFVSSFVVVVVVVLYIYIYFPGSRFEREA